MPYDDATDSGAADEKSAGKSFFLPPEYDHPCKPGDILKFRVVGKDADGNTEVEPLADEESDPWDKEHDEELEATMSPDMGGTMTESEAP